MEPIKVSVKQATEYLYNKHLGTYTMKTNPRYNYISVLQNEVLL